MISVRVSQGWKDPSRYQRFIAAVKTIDLVIATATKKDEKIARSGDRTQRAGALYYLSAEFKLGVTAREIALIYGIYPQSVVRVFHMINRALLQLHPIPWKINFSLEG